MTLKLFPVTKSELQKLQTRSLEIEQEIIGIQHDYFLTYSGLKPFLKFLSTRNGTVLAVP